MLRNNTRINFDVLDKHEHGRYRALDGSDSIVDKYLMKDLQAIPGLPFRPSFLARLAHPESTKKFDVRLTLDLLSYVTEEDARDFLLDLISVRSYRVTTNEITRHGNRARPNKKRSNL